MQTTTSPTPTPRKSRRRLYALAGFLTLFLATPYAFMVVAEWLGDRELAQIYAEMDAEDPNWRWADLIANQPILPPDERNAAVQVAKANKLRGKPYLATWLEAAKYTNARLPEKDAKALRAALDGVGAEFWQEARKLKEMPEGCLQVTARENPWEEGASAYLQHLEVMRLLQYDAYLRADDKDFEGAAESCQALLHAAHSIGDCPITMAQLVRFAGQGLAAGGIERTLGQGEIAEARLRQLQSALSRESQHNGLYHAWRGERAGLHQYYLLERAGTIPSYKNPRDSGDLKTRVLEMFPSLYWRGYPDHLRIQNGMVRASRLLEQAQPEAYSTLEDQVRRLHENSGILGINFDARYLLGFVQQHQKDRARLRCAIVAIAAERYRLQHQTWPSDIDDLVKTDLLKEPYADPFDGQPLRWKKTAEQLIIYSVGQTKLDDGGKLNSYGARPDGLGFVLWVPTLRGLPPPAVEKAK